MREKINFQRLEEISLDEIPVLSEANGESKKDDNHWSTAVIGWA